MHLVGLSHMPHCTPNNSATERRVRGQFNSRLEPVIWPHGWCDLTPVNYFLWRCVKTHVYSDNSATMDALEANIEEIIRELPAGMLGRVREKGTWRMDH